MEYTAKGLPKVIHYCWFGRGEKSPLIQRCIATWREKMPGWEIREWNEDNFDVTSIPYTAEAYGAKKYALRRQYFAETDETVNKRAKAALAGGLKPIICVGESLTQREQGVTEELIRMQVKIALNGVTADELKNVVIAYEPIWAIGTGKTATADQAEEVCAAIRKVVGELYGADAAKALTVQYGGSMNPKNAEELLSKPDVDGGLIGGASLKADQFAVIVEAATKG